AGRITGRQAVEVDGVGRARVEGDVATGPRHEDAWLRGRRPQGDAAGVGGDGAVQSAGAAQRAAARRDRIGTVGEGAVDLQEAGIDLDAAFEVVGARLEEEAAGANLDQAARVVDHAQGAAERRHRGVVAAGGQGAADEVDDAVA